jgi:predicted DNA-binding transcriptional regulator YafY
MAVTFDNLQFRMKKVKGAKKAGPKRKGKGAGNGEIGHLSRPQMARVELIRVKISEGTYPNSKSLAEDLECSQRTIKRLLALMQDQLNLPMKFDRERNGWRFTKPVPFFPSIPLTEREVVGLFVAQKSIEQYKGTSLEPVLAGAFRKMTARLDDSTKLSLGNLNEVVSIRPLAPGDADLEKFQLITEAIRDKRVVKFAYRNHGTMTTKVRTVHPLRVAYVNNLWTLFAFDPEARDTRKFVFFRISGLELLEERFTAKYEMDLNVELKGSMGVFKGNEKHDVVIEFDAWGADDVRGRTWHASQELVDDLKTGGLTVKMTLNNLEEIERWVLGFGKHAAVVAPPELKERVQKSAEAIQKRYSTANGR